MERFLSYDINENVKLNAMGKRHWKNALIASRVSVKRVTTRMYGSLVFVGIHV